MSGVFHQSVLLSADTQLSDLPSSCNPCKTSTKPPSIYSWSHPIFPFIPPTPLHRMMFCCQATESLSSLVTLSPPASLPSVFALCSLTVLTVVLFFFSLPSPTEVSALQTCTFKKKKKKKKKRCWHCFVYPCTHCDMSRWPEMVRRSQTRRGWKGSSWERRTERGKLLNVPLSATDLQEVQTDTMKPGLNLIIVSID